MILMHEDIPVADVGAFDGHVMTYKKILNPDLVPIGTNPAYGFQAASYLQSWHQSRSVPNGRQGLDRITAVTGKTPADGLLKSMGVSLTDRYWLKEESSHLTWKDVNFHDNGFEPAFCKAILEENPEWRPSPDYTTDGMMAKFWTTSAGIPFLSKIDLVNTGAESANEVIVSEFAIELGIDAVPYSFGRVGEYVSCDCPSFVTSPDVDYVSALQISHATGKRGQVLASYFDYELKQKEKLDNLRFLDALFHQEDRHEKNLGLLLKNGKMTLAPIFDSGTCLGIHRSKTTRSLADNLKFFGKPREDVMNDVVNVPNFSEKALLDKIKTTYERFHVPEERYYYAVEEAKMGIELANVSRERDKDDLERY